MFAGGATIDMLPSQLLVSVLLNESAGGETITDEEVCELRAGADAYQRGLIHVPNESVDNFEMHAIEQINAVIKRRNPECVNTYSFGSYDREAQVARLVLGTSYLAIGGAAIAVASGSVAAVAACLLPVVMISGVILYAR